MAEQPDFEVFLTASHRMRYEAKRDGRKAKLLHFGPDAVRAMLRHFEHVPMVSLKATAQAYADEKRGGELEGLPWKKMAANGVALEIES